MNRYRPRSIIHLTLVGFTVVSAPLLAALALALLNVDGLVKKSKTALFDATQALQLSHQLVKEIPEIERYARQFLVLKDSEVLALYVEEHGEFLTLANDLQNVPLDEAPKRLLDELFSVEHELYTLLQGKEENEKTPELATFYTRKLSALGRQLLVESSIAIQSKVNTIHSNTETTKNLLIVQSLILIPLALVLSLIFTFLITRPLQQIGRSIQQLGTGDFRLPIKISGPSDLQELGQHLNWLRNRLAEDEMRKASLLRHISHDLKTPLTAIREGAGLLRDNTLGKLNPQQREVTWILKTNSIKLQKKIEDLLILGETQRQFETKKRELVALSPLLEKVVRAHKLVIRSKNLSFRGQLEECEISGDPKQLRVILDNLFSNAIKYSPRNGKISVFLKVQENEIVLDIKDQGPGIDPQDESKLFDAYYQGSNPGHSTVKGTGLGLAIAQEFAKLHQGIIEVVRQSAGAHFRLTLPVGELR